MFDSTGHEVDFDSYFDAPDDDIYSDLSEEELVELGVVARDEPEPPDVELPEDYIKPIPEVDEDYIDYGDHQ